MACKTVADSERFHEKFLARKPQPTRLLESWAEILLDAFRYWDPIIANFIVGASLDFTNACVLEGRPELQTIVPTKEGMSFPWFLRQKNGLADAYAYFAFPMSICPDFSCYLEAIPDLSTYLCLANDIMS